MTVPPPSWPTSWPHAAGDERRRTGGHAHRHVDGAPRGLRVVPLGHRVGAVIGRVVAGVPSSAVGRLIPGPVPSIPFHHSPHEERTRHALHEHRPGLPQVGPLATPANIISVAQAADAAGYSSLWALDRLLAPLAPRTPYPASPDGELPDEQRHVLDPIGALTLAALGDEPHPRRHQRAGGAVVPTSPAGQGAHHTRSHQRRPDHRRARARMVRRRVRGSGACRSGSWHREVRRSSTCSKRSGRRASAIRGERFRMSGDDPSQAAATAATADAAGRLYTRRARRVARRADGWIPAGLPVEAIAPMFAAFVTWPQRTGGTPTRSPWWCGRTRRSRPPARTRPAVLLGLHRPGDAGHGRTRVAGADEMILELQGCARSLDELFEIAGPRSRRPSWRRRDRHRRPDRTSRRFCHASATIRARRRDTNEGSGPAGVSLVQPSVGCDDGGEETHHVGRLGPLA